MYINNCTGDKWISDPINNPQNTKYEDLQGAWHAAICDEIGARRLLYAHLPCPDNPGKRMPHYPRK